MVEQSHRTILLGQIATHLARTEAEAQSFDRPEPAGVFEPLEQRTLLSVTFGVIGGVPTFTGDTPTITDAANQSGGNIEYIANVGPATDTGLAVVAASQINVDLGDGSDSSTINHGGAGGFFCSGFLTINYDGGASNNLLFLQGTPVGTTVTSDQCSLFGGVGSGEIEWRRRVAGWR